uniref:aminotransferase class I/II-fold pyridoxal phosphate-dependent enzyme n=1 Tax=Eubacterium cellulosolvens TaxID=29322 RepID=UPI00055231AB|nr:aminotransferase class I/II-fold pyridoxal phosphate-dependent enzyme [[Eubacterium] cellulosolvens]
MDQKQTPLLDAIESFIKEEPAFFRIPGHRFERGVDRKALELFGDRAYRADLTEAEGLDDLHQPTGPILEAEKLAADLFGSDRCWFLVNGTTCGNQAMILATVGEGEKILVPRNAHKSVMMGLILSGAKPVWINPEYIEDFGISGPVDPLAVEEALEEDPEIKAVFLVSPTYYGICSDLKEIADICHKRQIPLLVDEAHGSHLCFSEDLPKSALQAGADLVAQSTHKTLGSMTQSSMLHIRSSLVDEVKVDKALKLVMSTSPNYLLMGSLDAARHLMAEHGEEHMERTVAMAEVIRKELEELTDVRILHRPDMDPTRIVLSAIDAGITGYEFQKRLYETGRVSTELSDSQNVVCVLTWGNTGEDVRRLIQTIKRVMQRHCAECLQFGSTDVEPVEDVEQLNLPQVAVTPREAYFSETEVVPLAYSIGRVAAESITPYPPGVPILYPGETVTREVYEKAMFCLSHKLEIHGPADKTLNTLRVIMNRELKL